MNLATFNLFILCAAITHALECPGDNEIESNCGSLCAPTCDHSEPQACPDVCQNMCVCQNGFIRSTFGGECVPLTNCNLEHLNCGPNEILKNEGMTCQTCSNYLFVKCAPVKKIQCYCKDGYVRRDDNNECTAIKSIKCGVNEVIQDNGFDCQTCSNYAFVRCASVNKRQCYCQPGFVRRDDTKECVSTDDCPK